MNTNRNGNRTRTHRVFVYGTLLRGLGNHGVMSHAGGSFITEAAVRGFRLVDTGWGYPGALPKLDLRCRARGEIFEVTDAGLARLDQLEGVPDLYTRRLVTADDGTRAWIYVMSARTAALAAGRPGGPALVRRGDWRAHEAAQAQARRTP